MNALLKLQEKNLLKYVMFILLTTLLNHDYAIRHVIFYHEWICSRLPIVLKTQWICFREQTYSNDIHSVLSTQRGTLVKRYAEVQALRYDRTVSLDVLRFSLFRYLVMLAALKVLPMPLRA